MKKLTGSMWHLLHLEKTYDSGSDYFSTWRLWLIAETEEVVPQKIKNQDIPGYILSKIPEAMEDAKFHNEELRRFQEKEAARLEKRFSEFRIGDLPDPGNQINV